ncbi:MAG: VPA1269 family protein [Opitutaceae bacterium]|nr:VPA1269 family protein [Opitutaceae bacterium]
MKAAVFQTTDGRQIHANLTDSPILLDDPKMDAALDLVERFRHIHRGWLLDHLCEETKSEYYEGPRSCSPLFGLSYALRKTPSGGKTCVFRHLRAKCLQDATWDACGLGDATPGERLKALIDGTIPHASQRAVLAAAIGDTAESAAQVLKNPDVLVFPNLEAILRASNSASDFFGRIAAMAASEPLRDDLPEEPRTGAYKVFLPSAFMFFAAQEGFVLLSPQRHMFVGGHERRELYLRLAHGRSTYISDFQQKDAVTSKPKLPDNQSELSAYLTMTSCTTLRSERDISVDLFTQVRDLADRLVAISGSDYYKVVFSKLNSKRKPDERIYENLSNRNSEKRALGYAFGWTRMTRGETPDDHFPKTAPKDYLARKDIIDWAVAFEEYLGSKENKAQAPIQSSLQRFLVWLHESGNIIHNFYDLERSHINDEYTDPSKSNCFRAHLELLKSKPKTKNVVLGHLSGAFDWLIAKRGLAPKNPIRSAQDAFKTGQARGRTVRNCIPPEVAELLKEANRRDDFALSKSLKKHLRTPLAGDGSPEWFPGIALFIDLLLCLPLRGFQGRFLDSGEGDEWVTVRRADGTLEQIRNPAKTSMRGRREGCLDFIPPIFKNPATLGLSINTNKTSEIENAGYKIPWCPPDLEANLRRMAKWQSERNPVKTPVPCMDKSDYKRHMNRSVANSVKKTFALFRDPDEREGWPISRQTVYEYWDLLQATVEDEQAEKGRTICLTETVRRGGRPVRKGIFDIHALRVTGITALLEAGLSPHIVMDVAGHSTIVMTLYYHKVDNGRIARELDAAKQRISEMAERGENSSDDFGRLGLFNTRNAEDSAGMELLLERQGRGPGGVSIMSHGICPGGDCSTGGEYDPSSRAHGPVAAGACSLCRYRLTGPAFLPGLVLNANRLMFELHTVAKEVAEANGEIAKINQPSPLASRLRGAVEVLTRKTDALATEWAAEVQYAQMAKDMLENTSEGGNQALALIGEVNIALEKRPEFVLLQTLAKGCQEVVDFKPTAVIEQHRLFLSELLTATDAGPFLLSIPRPLRDRASVMLGQAICDLLPDETLYGLSDGSVQPNEEIKRLADSVKAAAIGGQLDRLANETDDKNPGEIQ